MERKTLGMKEKLLNRVNKAHRFWIVLLTVLTYASIIAEIAVYSISMCIVTTDSLPFTVSFTLLVLIGVAFLQIPSIALSFFLRHTYATTHGRTRFGTIILIILLFHGNLLSLNILLHIL